MSTLFKTIFMGWLLSFTALAYAAPDHRPLARQSSVLPDHPLRIVSLSDLTTEMLLSLRISPIGVASPGSYRQQGKPNADALADIVSLGSAQQPDLEQLVRLKPDLILGISSLHAGLFTRLDALAPTLIYQVSLAPSDKDAVDNVEAMLRHLSRIVRRQTQAEQVLQRMHDAIARGQQVARRVGVTGQPLAVLYPIAVQGRFIISNEQTLIVSLANRLGGENPWPLKEAHNIHRRIDVQDLAAQPNLTVLFIGNAENSVLFKSPLWRALPVAQQRRYSFLKTSYWSFGGPATATALMTLITDALARLELP